ncbi:MAG: hypothetical protein QM478_00790 [Flavobacteriaceae bacterium]
MKKVVVTYLASLILFQGLFTNMDLIFETSELIEDYQLHKVKYGDNLTTFFSKHFGDLKESHQKQHQQEHKQHKHPVQNNTGNNQLVDFTLLALSYNNKNIDEIDTTSSNFHYFDLHSTFEKQEIFQPPQLT